MLYNKIIVLDDHPVVSQGLRDIVRFIPGVESVLVSSDAPRVNAVGGALYIVDLELGEGSGFDTIERLQASGVDCRILVYTMHEESWVKSKLLKYPIAGAVAKSEPLSLISEAVRAILKGGSFFSPVFAHDEDVPAQPVKDWAISDRERQVLRAICSGETSEAISHRLGLSLNTIHTYRRRLLDKFKVSNTAELVYVTKGLL